MANNPNNPFADLFKAWTECKVPNTSSLPAFDWEQWMATSRQNLEAIAVMNQVFVEGAQAVARRQTQIAQNCAEESLRLVKDLLASANSPEASIARQAEFVKQSVESAINNSKELVEMASKSNIEAIDVFNKRAGELMGEVGSIAGAANVNATAQRSAQNRKKDAA